jgi:hypothetical protein
MHLFEHDVQSDLRLRSGLILGMFIAGVALLAMPAVADDLEIYVAAPSGSDPWFTVMPLAGSAAEITRFSPLENHVRVNTPAIVCAGARGAATDCQVAISGDGGRYDLALTEGVEVAGRVLIGRTPATGGELRIRPEHLEASRPFSLPLFQERQTLTTAVAINGLGEFELCHVSAGEYTFELLLPGGQIHSVHNVIVPARRANVTRAALPPFVVAEGLRLSVFAIGSDGAPVTNTTIGVLQTTGAASTERRRFQQKADAEGAASFRGLDPNLPTVIACTAEGYARSQRQFATAPASFTCIMNRLWNATGRVVDSNRKGIAGAVVRATREHMAHTSANGGFELREIPPGEYDLSVTAPGYGITKRAISIAAADVVLGEIALPEGALATGRVIAATTEEPIAGAQIVLLERGDVSAPADEDGRFEIRLDAEGEDARVSAAGFADTDVFLRPKHRDQVIRLMRPGALKVQVWSRERNGSPCAGCTVTADLERRQRSAVTGPAGVAHFDGLAPGTYYVTYVKTRAGSEEVVVSGGGGKPVQVTPGTTAFVELGSPSRAVDIQLAPAPDARWTLSCVGVESAVIAEARGHGRFAVNLNAREAYRLILTSDETGVEVGTLPSIDHANALTVRIATGIVDVRFSAEQEQRPSMFELRDMIGKVVAWGSARARTVQIPHIPSGQYVITAGGRPISQSFHVAAGVTAIAIR